MRAAVEYRGNRGLYLRMGMTDEHRAVGAPVLDVLIAVDIDHAAARHPLDVEWIRRPIAVGVGDSAGQGAQRSGEQLTRARRARPIEFFDIRCGRIVHAMPGENPLSL